MRPLVLAVTLVIATARIASATLAYSPGSPVNVGNVLLGTSQSVVVTISSTTNVSVDLVIGSCTGGNGSFTLSPATAVNLNNPAMVTVTYMATGAGARSCTVSVFTTGTSTSQGSFTITAAGVRPPTISTSSVNPFPSVRALDTAISAHTSLRSVTVSNSGDQALTISNVMLTGDFAIDASSANGTMASIGAGGVRVWTFQFNPSAIGARSGAVTFVSNDPVTPNKTVNLSGDGTSGSFTAAAGNAGSFGTVGGGSSATLDVTLAHSGGNPKGILTIAPPTITNASLPWFSVTATPSTLNSVSTTGAVTIRCNPPVGSTATATATLTISADSDGSPAASTHNLSCTGGASLLTFDVSSLDFEPTLVGTLSPAKTLTITNSGTSNASVMFQPVGSNAGRFSTAGPGGCGAGTACLIPMGGGTIIVTTAFTPTVEGTVGASFVLSGGGPQVGFVTSGRGIDRHISLPDIVTAPQTYRGALALVPIPITNSGEYPIVVSALEVGGDTAVWSVHEQTLLPLMIPGLESRDVMIGFTPNIGGKAGDGQLLIVNDDTKFAGGMPTVFLQGNGVDRNVQVGPLFIDLGDRAVGVATRLSDIQPDNLVSILNQDEAAFTIRTVGTTETAFEAQDMAGGPISGLPLDVGGVQMIDVVFTPQQEGEYTAVLGVYLDEDPTPHSVVEVRARAIAVSVHGGGGCSTGTGGGPLVLLAFLALRRRRR